MNGRVYDANIGRFIGADPFVQAPYFSQSLNRYSYTFNNPLAFTDPSGFITSPDGPDEGPDNEPTQPRTGSYHGIGANFRGFTNHNERSDAARGLRAIRNPETFQGPVRPGAFPHYTSFITQLNSSAYAKQPLSTNSWTAELGQGFLNAVPGAYYAGKSELAWREGRYGYSVALYGAALADAFVGVATLGQSSLVAGVTRAGSGFARAAPTLSMDVDLLAQYGPRVAAESGGFFNVVTHADENFAAVLRNGEWLSLSHRVLARFIQGAAGYTGQPVRLIACSSGACATGLAQNLANKLGVPVLAPTADAFVSQTGAFWTSGEWRLFTPGL